MIRGPGGSLPLTVAKLERLGLPLTDALRMVMLDPTLFHQERLSRVDKAPSECPRRRPIRWANPAQGASGGVTPMWIAVLKQCAD